VSELTLKSGKTAKIDSVNKKNIAKFKKIIKKEKEQDFCRN